MAAPVAEQSGTSMRSLMVQYYSKLTYCRQQLLLSCVCTCAACNRRGTTACNNPAMCHLPSCGTLGVAGCCLGSCFAVLCAILKHAAPAELCCQKDDTSLDPAQISSSRTPLVKDTNQASLLLVLIHVQGRFFQLSRCSSGLIMETVSLTGAASDAREVSAVAATVNLTKQSG